MAEKSYFERVFDMYIQNVSVILLYNSNTPGVKSGYCLEYKSNIYKYQPFSLSNTLYLIIL